MEDEMPISGELVFTKKEVEKMVLDYLQNHATVGSDVDYNNLSSDFIYKDNEPKELVYVLRFKFPVIPEPQ
jgi:hypothetical protein